jgi:hypothetical protein
LQYLIDFEAGRSFRKAQGLYEKQGTRYELWINDSKVDTETNANAPETIDQPTQFNGFSERTGSPYNYATWDMDEYFFLNKYFRHIHRSVTCWWRIPESRGYGCLIESAAVLLPPVRGEAQSRLCFTGLWQPSFQARVCAMPIEIALKSAEFFLQVGRRPE